MSIPMVALVPLIYAGRRMAAGTEFAVRGQSDARLLLALGRADFAMAAPEAEPIPVIVAPEPEAPNNTVIPRAGKARSTSSVKPVRGRRRRMWLVSMLMGATCCHAG